MAMRKKRSNGPWSNYREKLFEKMEIPTRVDMTLGHLQDQKQCVFISLRQLMSAWTEDETMIAFFLAGGLGTDYWVSSVGRGRGKAKEAFCHHSEEEDGTR